MKRNRGNISQHIKGYIRKNSQPAFQNRENLEAISIKLRMRQGYPLFPVISNTVLESLDEALRLEKEIKRIKIGKKEVKQPLFVDAIPLYIRDLQNSSMKLL